MRHVGRVVVLAAWVVVGCGEPKAGDACEEGANGCNKEVGHLALECFEGTYREVPCPGAGGCRGGAFESGAPAIVCDIDGVQQGTNCLAVYRDLTKCLGPNVALVCSGLGTWVQRACEEGCFVNNKQQIESVADGDLCR